MKPILEYLVNNHITDDTYKDVKSGKIGDRFTIDDIPCTLVYISNDKYYLISDIYCGQSGDGYKMVNKYKENASLDNSFAFYLWKKPTKQKPDYLPNGWYFPDYVNWILNGDITRNLNKYVSGYYTTTNTMWVSVGDNTRKGRSSFLLMTWNIDVLIILLRHVAYVLLM